MGLRSAFPAIGVSLKHGPLYTLQKIFSAHLLLNSSYFLVSMHRIAAFEKERD